MQAKKKNPSPVPGIKPWGHRTHYHLRMMYQCWNAL